MVDDNGDTVALYAANNRRFKKPFFKNNSGKPFVKNFNKSNFNSKPKPEIFTQKEDNLKLSIQKPSEKSASKSSKENTEEKKVLGDSGYDCSYCHGKNHFAKDCMLHKQNERKPQVKDEAYYASKMVEVRVKTKDLALMAADDRQGSYQVWSSDSDDDEVRKPSHSVFMAYDVGKSFLKDTSEKLNDDEMMKVEATAGLGFVTSEGFEMIAADTPKTWFEDSSDDDEEVCLMANDTRLTIPEQVSKLLSSFKIPISHSAPIINEITRDCSVMHKLLIDAKNREVLTEQKHLSLRGKVESLKLALEKSNLRISLLEENREKFINNHDVILKQRNIFCETAKRLYAHITRIYHSADGCNVQHRQLLPFIEFKLKEVDSISYECESIVSVKEKGNLLTLLPQEIPILKHHVPQCENKYDAVVEIMSENDSESDSDMEEVDCSTLSLHKSSSISASPSEDISQLSSEDKGKTKIDYERENTDNLEIVKTKTQIFDECESYEDYLKNSSKRLVPVACVYPKVSYFKYYIFVIPGGMPLIDNDLQKIVDKDNSTVTEEGFFSSSKMLENQMNENMEVKINIRKQDLYGHNIYNRLCYEKEKIPKNLSNLLNIKNDNHVYTNRNYKQIQVMEKPITPKMDVFQLIESKESVPHVKAAEKEASKIKSEISYPSMEFPNFKDKNKTQIAPKPVVHNIKILQKPQCQNQASTSKTNTTVVISKPTVKILKSKQTQNLVKMKTPFEVSIPTNAVASTSGTKPTDSNNLSLNDFKLAYEEYLCTSTSCSSISTKSTIVKPKQNWKRNDLKENLTVKTKSSKSSSSKVTTTASKSKLTKQIWVPKSCTLSVTSNSSVLTKSLSESCLNSSDSSVLTKSLSESCSNSSDSCSLHEASEDLINLNTNEISKEAVMSNERYDSKWYMDSGCSRHMTGKKEYLRDYRTLDDAGNVRFGNNETCPIRGYGKITNGEFTISRVAFVEGLKHTLVSISQLVVGTGNAVTFNNQGSVITKEETKEVLLKSERKGSMFPLNLKPVTGGQSLCLLSKANTDVSWLWHRRLAHLNFKDLNKLAAMDLVRGMPALKFDNDSLCSACEHGKQTKQRHPTVINPKITEPLSLLYMDLCGPSAVESIRKKKYILVIVDDFSRFTWVLFL
ncbi:hypothetical protein L2E82_30211 [Cichorium intybus]|uniref:Uncharacterized protein n=1 Tax=Cichorium intybus TaxID=13427 RepID=A0ACB9CZS4_CICIN|nr:hypothetical protein L2E82_30211 [Cichorium intybus]